MKMSVVPVPLVLGRRALIVILMLLAAPMFGKRRDDVVVMKNGDRFTGEIKSLQHGELIFKSGYMIDPVHLDWKRVERLESKDIYIVGLSSGARVTGSIGRMAPPASNSGGEFHIVAETSTIDVSPAEVIAIQQHEVNFWNQLTGSITPHRIQKLYHTAVDFTLPGRQPITLPPITTSIDIGNYLETKLEAFRAHTSQQPLWAMFEEHARKRGGRELFHLAAADMGDACGTRIVSCDPIHVRKRDLDAQCCAEQRGGLVRSSDRPAFVVQRTSR